MLAIELDSCSLDMKLGMIRILQIVMDENGSVFVWDKNFPVPFRFSPVLFLLVLGTGLVRFGTSIFSQFGPDWFWSVCQKCVNTIKEETNEWERGLINNQHKNIIILPIKLFQWIKI